MAGFLPFNAYKASLILGDSGSNLLGFLIGTLAILGQAKIGTALLVLGIPLLDVAWTIVRRHRSGQGITSRDTQHLHHRLVDAGLTRPQVTMVYVLLCAAFGASALLLERAEKLFALAALAVLTAGLLLVSSRNSSKKQRCSDPRTRHSEHPRRSTATECKGAVASICAIHGFWFGKSGGGFTDSIVFN